MSDVLWVACLACRRAWRIDFDPEPLDCTHMEAPIYVLECIEHNDFDEDDVLMLANDQAIRYPEKPTSPAGQPGELS